jgi:hypothetical protein
MASEEKKPRDDVSIRLLQLAFDFTFLYINLLL